MARVILAGSLEDKLIDYLIVKRDSNLQPTFTLKEDTPEDVKKYFPKWLKERDERKGSLYK